MKFIVAVDMEGIACAYAPFGGGVEDSFNIASVRRQATREADAAVRALFAKGASEVIVWDNHARGCSLDYDVLDERCKIACGATVISRYPMLDGSFSGVVLIGYHARASADRAAISHTYSAEKYQYVKINGKEFGEIGLDAAIAGAHGVPVIFVSSDNYGIAEAKDLLPWAETVETKQSFAYTRIISKHPKAVVKEIYAGVERAVQRLAEMKCFDVPSPVDVEIRYRRTDAAIHAQLTDIEGNPFARPDGYTRTGRMRTVENVLLSL